MVAVLAIPTTFVWLATSGWWGRRVRKRRRSWEGMIHNSLCPGQEFFRRSCEFCSIAMFTTGHDITRNVSLIVVTTVNSVSNIRTIAGRMIHENIGFCSTVITGLTGNFPYPIFGQGKFITSFICTGLKLSKVTVEVSFPKRKTVGSSSFAAARHRKSSSKITPIHRGLIATRALANPVSSIGTSHISAKNSKLPVNISGFIYELCHTDYNREIMLSANYEVR